MHRWYVWLTLAISLIGSTLDTVHASDVDLPIVEPLHIIFVEAETVAKEVRGPYDVLAFEGNCKLKQGELQTTGDRITLWIERRNQLGIELPGKIICQVDGQVEATWDGQKTSARQSMDHTLVQLTSSRLSCAPGSQTPRHSKPRLESKQQQCSASSVHAKRWWWADTRTASARRTHARQPER